MANKRITVEYGKAANGGRPRPHKHNTPPSKIYQHQSSQSPSKGDVITVTQRLSPARVVHSSPNNHQGQGQSSSPGPRTSPGLVSGHYAGCKWTEPPSPSALPLPPQHWMQTSHPIMLPFRAASSKYDIAQQLKVLLKVHA